MATESTQHTEEEGSSGIITGTEGGTGSEGAAGTGSGKARLKKKSKRMISDVIVHVYASFNNTLITVTDVKGNTLSWATAGGCGFRGSRKGTPFVAFQIASNLAKDMKLWGVKNVEVNLQGPGSGRDSVVRALQASGLGVTTIRDVTPLPHNGCRPAKKRRV